MGKSESCRAAFFDFGFEFFCYCAAADESAGDWVRRRVPATAAVDGAEEWVGQVPEFDLMHYFGFADESIVTGGNL